MHTDIGENIHVIFPILVLIMANDIELSLIRITRCIWESTKASIKKIFQSFTAFSNNVEVISRRMMDNIATKKTDSQVESDFKTVFSLALKFSFTEIIVITLESALSAIQLITEGVTHNRLLSTTIVKKRMNIEERKDTPSMDSIEESTLLSGNYITIQTRDKIKSLIQILSN